MADAAPKRQPCLQSARGVSTTYTYHPPGQTVYKPSVPAVKLLGPAGEKGGGQKPAPP